MEKRREFQERDRLECLARNPPEAMTMGVIGFWALLANAISFGLLWMYRSDDADMQSAWLCTRNDAAGNLAVLLAAVGVFGYRDRMA